MKVRDMFTVDFANKFGDIDVYDSDYDVEGIAFCGPCLLTEEGKDHYSKVLDLEVEFLTGGFLGDRILVNSDGDWTLCTLAQELFWGCAGYCAEDDWDRWFVYLDDDEPVFTPMPSGFIDDQEKMRDFFYLTKDEFLASYSYLTEEEYDDTLRYVRYIQEGRRM